jgi:hypothetical protein
LNFANLFLGCFGHDHRVFAFPKTVSLNVALSVRVEHECRGEPVDPAECKCHSGKIGSALQRDKAQIIGVGDQDVRLGGLLTAAG